MNYSGSNGLIVSYLAATRRMSTLLQTRGKPRSAGTRWGT
jgi:hypothetical protein